jgi:16S rRNA (cytosine967-C5)-methyltransferase
MISVSNNFLFNIALDCLQGYNFLEPFSIYLKKYFQANSKLGSRDRRNIRQLCYAWWRLGNAGKTLPNNERMFLALFLSYQQLDAFSERIFKETNVIEYITHSPFDKWNFINSTYPNLLGKDELFPFQEDLMNDFVKDDFVLDGFYRRGLWVRAKKQFKGKVVSYFDTNNISYQISESVPHAFLLSDDFDIVNSNPYQQGWIEIQDLSSQILGGYYNPSDNEKWLDACAASGGKSLQLLDSNNKIDLTVTDIRESILTNLQVRFKRNNIHQYRSMVVDWSSPNPDDGASLKESFDVIIADVPCSGSGTWARTPEQKLNITKAKIQSYSTLQYAIVSNLLPLLKKGGRLFYSTCSVYQSENIAVVNKLISNFEVELVQSKTISGIALMADTMYYAELIKK